MSFSWRTLIANEVWTCQNYLPLSLLREILNCMEQGQRSDINGSEKQLISQSYYDYKLHSWGFRSHPEFSDLRKQVHTGLNELFKSIGSELISHDYCNPMQLFTKSFSEKSRYDLHVEPEFIFGPFSFMIYLQSENSGDLHFPSFLQVQEYLRRRPHENETWRQSQRFFSENKIDIRYVGPCTIRPKKNLCVVFRTGSAHYVDPLPLRKTSLTRPAIGGWPFAYKFETYYGGTEAETF